MCDKHQPDAYVPLPREEAPLVARSMDSILSAVSAYSTDRKGDDLVLTPLPHHDVGTLQVSLHVAFIATMQDKSGTGIVNTVLSYGRDKSGNGEFHAFCVDRFSKGMLDSDVKNERINGALEQVAPLLRQEVAQSLNDLFGKFKHADRNCGFWKIQNHNKDHVCEDTAVLLAMVAERYPGESVEELLIAEFERLSNGGTMVAKKSKAFSPFDYFAFHLPILSVGESGSGKTLGALMYAKENNLQLVKLSCEAGTTGADITGYYMKAPDGSMVWVDGKMTAAFRLAAKGTKKVMLLVDEMLRVDVRELAIFLSAFELNPLTKKYVLSTGRILSCEDGLAVLEELEVDPRFLCIVATTNIGGKYAVGDMDKALQDRFVVIRLDNDEAGIKAAALSQCKASFISEDVADKCAKFWVAMGRAKTSSLIAETPSKRLINRAIAHAQSPAMVPVLLKHFAPHFVGLDSDGFPLAEQVKKVEEIVDKAFA